MPNITNWKLRYKGVTIATNMAGRGTDILLGGNPDYMVKNLLKQQGVGPVDANYQEEYKKTYEKFKKQTDDEHNKVVGTGGLHVLGTERHEARRIDNQLRGRSGRQGDPGSSRFYVSLEDELMRLFGSDRMIGVMDRLGLEEGQRIEHPWVTKSIEIAQRRVEQHNFEIRKQLLEYDNVMNKQREIIYGQRLSILEGSVLKDDILEHAGELVTILIGRYLTDDIGKERDVEGLLESIKLTFGVTIAPSVLDAAAKEEAGEAINKAIADIYAEKENAFGSQLHDLERMLFLQIIDAKWKDHLYSMDYLREGIGLRAYGQRDPLVEYKREAFNMFQEMMDGIKDEALEMIFKIQAPKPMERFRGVFSGLSKELVHQEFGSFEAAPAQQESDGGFSGRAPAQEQEPQATKQAKNIYANVGRNDPCPCGAIDPNTGKPIKFKKCHGR
jgi:preprotein translocase subunit SecA